MVQRSELKGKIQTVTGIIEPEMLGSTIMHEHILWDITPPALADEDPGPEISTTVAF